MKSARVLLLLSPLIGPTACSAVVGPTACSPVLAAPSATPAVQSGMKNRFLSFDIANQRPIGAAATPLAMYLLEMHKRIHPLFTGKLFKELDQLPKESPLNNPNLAVQIAIVIGPDGGMQAMKVLRSSGMTIFDLAAFDMVSHAGPFGPTPEVIRSSDGNLYVNWDFHRSERACELLGARPFILGPATSPSP